MSSNLETEVYESIEERRRRQRELEEERRMPVQSRTVHNSQAEWFSSYKQIKRFSKPNQACINPSPVKRPPRKEFQHRVRTLDGDAYPMREKKKIDRDIPLHLIKPPVDHQYKPSLSPKKKKENA